MKSNNNNTNESYLNRVCYNAPGALSIMFILAVVNGLSYGVVLPSLERYITAPKDALGLNESTSFFSYIVSIFSVGEVMGSLVFGYLSTKWSHRQVMLSLYPAFIIGNILYSMATAGWMVLLARYLVGFYSGGVNTTVRAYIPDYTPPSKRTHIYSIMVAVNSMAMGLGPVVASLLTHFDEKLWILKFDKCRSPGWFLMVLGVISLICTLLFFEAPKSSTFIKPSTRRRLDSHDSNLTNYDSKFWNTNGGKNSIFIVLLCMFFANNISFSLAETLTTPIMGDSWGMSIAKTSYVYMLGGLMCLIGVIILLSCASLVSDAVITQASQILLLISFAIMADYQSINRTDQCNQYNMNACLNSDVCTWNQNGHYGDCNTCAKICHNTDYVLNIYQYFIGFGLMNLGFVIGRTTMTSLYSKLLGECQQGMMMGILVACGSSARIVGPLLGVSIYLANHRKTYGIMFLLMGIFVFLIILFAIIQKSVHDLLNKREQEFAASDDDGGITHEDAINSSMYSPISPAITTGLLAARRTDRWAHKSKPYLDASSSPMFSRSWTGVRRNSFEYQRLSSL